MRVKQFTAHGHEQTSLACQSRVVSDVCNFAGLAERMSADDSRNVFSGQYLLRYIQSGNLRRDGVEQTINGTREARQERRL